MMRFYEAQHEISNTCINQFLKPTTLIEVNEIEQCPKTYTQITLCLEYMMQVIFNGDLSVMMKKFTSIFNVFYEKF